MAVEIRRFTPTGLSTHRNPKLVASSWFRVCGWLFGNDRLEPIHYLAFRAYRAYRSDLRRVRFHKSGSMGMADMCPVAALKNAP